MPRSSPKKSRNTSCSFLAITRAIAIVAESRFFFFLSFSHMRAKTEEEEEALMTRS
jgi:hypothetical protein